MEMGDEAANEVGFARLADAVAAAAGLASTDGGEGAAECNCDAVPPSDSVEGLGAALLASGDGAAAIFSWGWVDGAEVL